MGSIVYATVHFNFNETRFTLRRIAVAVTIFFLCTVIGFVSCAVITLRRTFSGGCPESDPSQIQNLAQFTLPPSAKNLKSSCGGFQGWGASAEFEMNPADLDQFIASTRLIEPLDANVEPDDTILKDAADDTDSYLYGKFEVNEFSQAILIDTSDPATYKVYVQVYGG